MVVTRSKFGLKTLSNGWGIIYFEANGSGSAQSILALWLISLAMSGDIHGGARKNVYIQFFRMGNIRILSCMPHNGL